MRGEVEKENKVLVLRRIYVTYHLQAEPGNEEKIQRALEIHANYCPVARSIRDSIDIFTDVEITEIPPEGSE